VVNKKFKVLGPCGNTGSYIKRRRIPDAEWFPGVNMCYRSEALKNYSLPEPLGYNLLQDMDISYYVFKKYGNGSLVITDKALVKHRVSLVERYDDYKRTLAGQEDRFIFYYRYFNNPSGKIKFIWSNFGLILLKTLDFIFRPGRESYFRLKYSLKALKYCLKNRRQIRDGKYRSFLNKDLSFKGV